MAEGISPHSGGTVPDLHRVPFPLALMWRETSIAAVSVPRAVSVWLPVAAWAGVIFVLSSVPSLSTGLGTWDFVLRKLAHLGEYAVLGALLARALATVPAVGSGIAYAATDEIHQTFVPGREGSIVDVALDALGVGLGVFAYRRLRR